MPENLWSKPNLLLGFASSVTQDRDRRRIEPCAGGRREPEWGAHACSEKTVHRVFCLYCCDPKTGRKNSFSSFSKATLPSFLTIVSPNSPNLVID